MPPSMRIKVALQFLVDGYQYARDLGVPVEEFPVSLETMQRHAVAEIDLFWLLKKGYAGALWDGVLCEKILLHELTAGINFVATPAGFVFANQWLASQGEFQSSNVNSGLAPTVRQSGDRTEYGAISREGRRELRAVWVQRSH